MANTLEDLYFKYIDQVGSTLEDDRYFQYLYAMVQAGSNVLHQKHQILNKVVDERWISIIEDSLDAINNVINNPRRFIATNEEVVPVALAKKITADSVRHLSQNTQFIASSEDGNIQPTRILNVSTEESYDLYENRFIYHLIYRLIAFVDKRTDVIFWSTGNETKDVLSMESSVDDAYEQISYKIQMTIKNTQSLVENDNDNMQVFMRIDRVRRLVFALRSSAFCSLMAGCAKVHSPIQRTNLMMKDPDYRACYKLWQFLESYDEVGYSIEEIDSSLQFDEEYMIQMYTNMITNYTVFKSILEGDGRDLKELEKQIKEPVKPKFIKEIKEEIVENRDLPDVEIRQVFVEEVTEAQLEAEAKLKEMTSRCEEAEESEAQAQRQIQSLYQQLSESMEQQTAVEDELEQVMQERDDQKIKFEADLQAQKESFEADIKNQLESFESDIQSQKEAYETQLSDTKQDYEGQLSDMKQNHEGVLSDTKQDYEGQLSDMKQDYEGQLSDMKQSYEGQLSDTKQDYEGQLSDMKQSYEGQLSDMKQDYEGQLSDMKQDYEGQLSDMKQSYEGMISTQMQQHTDEVTGLKADYEARIIAVEETSAVTLGKLQSESEDRLAQTINRYETQIVESKQSHETQIASMKSSYETQLSEMKASYETQLSDSQQSYETQIGDMKQSYETQIGDMKQSYETQLADMKQSYETQLADMKQSDDERQHSAITALTADYEARIKALEEDKARAVQSAKYAEIRVEKADRARRKAEEKAEGTRLSRYIIASLSGRKSKQENVPEMDDHHEITVETEAESVNDATHDTVAQDDAVHNDGNK